MELQWRRLASQCRRRLLAPAYRAYEHRLLRQVKAFPLPRHVGLILDGNRRFARQNHLHRPEDIYTAGANKLDDLLEWCRELGIPAVTLWVLSTDNRNRPAEEVSGILASVEKKLKSLARDSRFLSRQVQVRAVGRLELLPTSTLAVLQAAEAATKDHNGVHLTIAAAYGGREEIVDAVRGLLREELAQGKTLGDVIDLVTPETIGRYLYSPDLPDPDLIIRTSGEIRLSGFLLWQCVFSEFYFTDVYWPAFRRVDFLRALRAFQQRERRFGK
jgi:short-chain Z-isoprenyl diphosphate synthase